MVQNEFESDVSILGGIHPENRWQRPSAWPKSVNVCNDKYYIGHFDRPNERIECRFFTPQPH
jgi:hypothetical protein